MSKYTTELRFICEKATGSNESVGYLDVPEIINNSRPYIFDFDYPIFDNSYKSVIETKIIRHFYTREIAFETVGLWKLKLWTKLNEIMPYYNKLYNSELLEFNPFYDVDLTTDHIKNNEGENHKDGEGARDTTTTPNTTDTQTLDTQGKMTNNLSDATTVNSTSSTEDSSESTGDKTGSGNDVKWDYYSDTPQGNIYDFPGEAHDNSSDQMTYLTNARKNTDAYNNTEHVENESNGQSETTNQGTSTTLKTGTQINDKSGTITMAKTGNIKVDDDNTYSEDGNYNSTEDYLQHVKGKSGGASYSKLLEEYRKTFLNIDMMVIKDLEPLFLHIW